MMKKVKEIRKFDDIQIGDAIYFQWSEDYPIVVCKVIDRKEGSAEIADIKSGTHYIVIRGIHERNLFIPEVEEDLEEMERLEAMERAENAEYQTIVDMYTDPETGEVDWAEVYEATYMMN